MHYVTAMQCCEPTGKMGSIMNEYGYYYYCDIVGGGKMGVFKQAPVRNLQLAAYIVQIKA